MWEESIKPDGNWRRRPDKQWKNFPAKSLKGRVAQPDIVDNHAVA
jgi:hypothetical protein